jgi:hypothetical protein
MNADKEQIVKAFDEKIVELRRKITTWQLHRAQPIAEGNLQDQIDDANRQIMDLEARKSIALGEAL